MGYLLLLEHDAKYDAPKNKHDKGYKLVLSKKRIFVQLLGLGNLIGAVFYIDQEHKFDEVIKRLKKIIDLLNGLSRDDFNLFKRWLKNAVVRGMEEEKAKEITKIIEETEEVDSMVYGIEIALREKMKEMELKGRLEGKMEGILEGKLEGKLEGILEGKLEGKLEDAKNMLDEGMSMEQISRITKIPVDELQRLLQNFS